MAGCGNGTWNAVSDVVKYLRRPGIWTVCSTEDSREVSFREEDGLTVGSGRKML